MPDPAPPPQIGWTYRPQFAEELCQQPQPICPVLEIRPELFIHRGGRSVWDLKKLSQKYTLIAHSMSLNLYDSKRPNIKHLRALRSFLQEYNIQFLSDHLAQTHDDCGCLHGLNPLPLNRNQLKKTVSKIQKLQDFFGQPLAFENLARNHTEVVLPQITELDFVLTLLEKTQCHFLFDLTDLWLNTKGKIDILNDWLNALPSNQVLEIHISEPQKTKQQGWQGLHNKKLSPKSLNWLVIALKRLSPQFVVLERENNIKSLSEIKLDLEKISHATHPPKIKAAA